MKNNIEKRTYKVIDHDTAKSYNLKPLSGSEWNRFALVAMRGEVLDNLVSWGYNSDNLQKIADARNNDLAMLGRMVKKSNKKIDTTEEV